MLLLFIKSIVLWNNLGLKIVNGLEDTSGLSRSPTIVYSTAKIPSPSFPISNLPKKGIFWIIPLIKCKGEICPSKLSFLFFRSIFPFTTRPIPSLTANDVFTNEGSSENLPYVKVKLIEDAEIFLNECIVEVGFAKSKSEVRKLIKNSGVKINRVLVDNELKILSYDDFYKNEILVSVGKKKHFIIKLLD